MRVLISHLTGNLNSIAAAQAYSDAGFLAEFHVSLFVPNWVRRLSVGLGLRRSIFGRRIFPASLKPMLRTHPLAEFLRLASRSSAQIKRSRLGRRCGSLEQTVKSFDAAVARALNSRHRVQAVHAYMDTAEQTFRVARQLGIRTIYELPTPYWRFTRDLVVEEAVKHPEWSMTLPDMGGGSEMMQRRERELELADLVIVPSEFVRESLKLAPPFRAPIHVVPYGSPEILSGISVRASSPPSLRVIYVGSLNQGKGLAYLAEAMKGLEDIATLTVIGSQTNTASCAALDHMLSTHRHRSGLSHEEVLVEMRHHDVLVLPTLYEGLALVLLEAMSCGLPVVTTPNSGLAGRIENGREGFLVPVRSASAIHERLRQLAGDAGLLMKMRQAAHSWSKEHSWRRYGEQLLDVVAQ